MKSEGGQLHAQAAKANNNPELVLRKQQIEKFSASLT